MPSRPAAELVARWHIPVAPLPGAVRYSASGNWYHGLTRFPGVLVDREGYVVFESEAKFRACPQLRIGPKGDIGVRRGVRAIPGYVPMETSIDVPQSRAPEVESCA